MLSLIRNGLSGRLTVKNSFVRKGNWEKRLMYENYTRTALKIRGHRSDESKCENVGSKIIRNPVKIVGVVKREKVASGCDPACSTIWKASDWQKLHLSPWKWSQQSANAVLHVQNTSPRKHFIQCPNHPSGSFRCGEQQLCSETHPQGWVRTPVKITRALWCVFSHYLHLLVRTECRLSRTASNLHLSWNRVCISIDRVPPLHSFSPQE